MIIKVSVTQDHINKGETRNNRECPIALAIKDCDINGRRVSVGCTNISLTAEFDLCTHYKLPLNAQRWLREFDDGHPVTPIEFKLVGED